MLGGELESPLRSCRFRSRCPFGVRPSARRSRLLDASQAVRSQHSAVRCSRCGPFVPSCGRISLSGSAFRFPSHAFVGYFLAVRLGRVMRIGPTFRSSRLLTPPRCEGRVDGRAAERSRGRWTISVFPLPTQWARSLPSPRRSRPVLLWHLSALATRWCDTRPPVDIYPAPATMLARLP